MEGAATLPFDAAMQEAHSRIMLAHRAALGTLDAELRSMRAENMRLRAQLAQSCVSVGGLRSSKTPLIEAQVADDGAAIAIGYISTPIAGDECRTNPAVSAAACNETGPAGPAASSPPLQPALSQAPSASPTPQGSAPDAVLARDAVDALLPVPAPDGDLGTDESSFGREHEILDTEATVSDSARVVGEEGADGANVLEVTSPAAPTSMESSVAQKCDGASLEVSAASPDSSPSSGRGSTRLSGEVVCAEEANERASLERALEAVLALHSWQHLDVTWESGDRWIIAGSPFRLCCGGGGAPSAAGVEDVADFWKTFEILASEDDGESWEPLEEVIRKRRLQKVVRTAPFATSTLEYNPELLHVSPPSPSHVGAGGVSKGIGGFSDSCAASTPCRAAVAGGPLSLADLANISSRSQTPPAPRLVPAAQASAALPVSRSSGPTLPRAPFRGALPQHRSMSALSGATIRTQARLGSWT